MTSKSWKISFFISTVFLICSNAYWFMLAIDSAVTDKYQSMDIYHKEEVIKELGRLIVKGSKIYSKKDMLHLLRQSKNNAFIVEEGNILYFDNVVFVFENDKLVEVKE